MWIKLLAEALQGTPGASVPEHRFQGSRLSTPPAHLHVVDAPLLSCSQGGSISSAWEGRDSCQPSVRRVSLAAGGSRVALSSLLRRAPEYAVVCTGRSNMFPQVSCQCPWAWLRSFTKFWLSFTSFGVLLCQLVIMVLLKLLLYWLWYVFIHLFIQQRAKSCYRG